MRRGLILLLALAPLVASSAPDQRRRTTFSQGDGTTCLPVPGVGLRCSDGRTTTTTRASAVPCETAPGVWTYAAPGEACVSVRGLEAWGANTTLIQWGHRLDQAPWRAVEGATISGRILSGPPGSARLLQAGIDPAAGVWTIACSMRALTGDSVRLRVYQEGGTGGTTVTKEVGPEWATYSATWEIGGEPTQLSVHIYPDGSTLEIEGCWFTESSTPGRPCWAEDGSAPYTCSADAHTISTEGWPTEEGSVTVVGAFGPRGGRRYLLDGRDAGALNAPRLFANADGTVFLNGYAVSLSAGMIDDPGVVHVWRIEWEGSASGGTLRLLRDGAQVASGTRAAAGGWGSVAKLGGYFGGVTEQLKGSISRLSWSSK